MLVKNKSRLTLWLFVAFLCFVLLISPSRCDIHQGRNRQNADTVIITKCDTVVRIDTFVRYEPVPIVEYISDTVYYPIQNLELMPVPVWHKHYSEPQQYDVWISGAQPLSLDSIKLYNRDITKTVTNTTTITRYQKITAWRLYTDFGLNKIGDELSPELGLRLESPKNLAIDASVGLIEKRPMFAIKVGTKIYER